VVFNKPINGSTFTSADITLNTFDSIGIVQSIIQTSANEFEVVVGGLTIRPNSAINPVSISINANTVADIYGNFNSQSTNGSNPTVDYLVPPPNVNPIITNSATPTLTGACATGNPLTITVNGQNYNTTCSATGTWSQTLPTTTNGTYDVKVADNTLGIDNVANGNNLQALKVDTSKPQITIEQAASQADPTNNSTIKYIVNITEIGTGIDSSTFDISDFTLAGTSTASITNMTMISAGVYEVTVTPTTSGTVILSMAAGKFQDLAGNDNTASTSTDNTVTFDNTSPTIPTVNPISTNDNTPTVTGTCEAGTTIKVQVGSQTQTTTCAANGTYSVTFPTPIPDGQYDIVVTSTDTSGNSTVDVTTNELTIDTVAPSAPTSSPDMTSASDTGTSNTDNITSETTPEFTGNCTPGNTVTLYNNGISIGSQLCPVSGTYSITPSTPLANGLNNITSTFTDPTGNTSPASPILPIVIDINTPIAPVINSVTSPNNDNTPTFTATGEPGATVTVRNGTNTLCTAVVQPNGSWTCTPSAPLTDGNHNITATQTDPAGNTSPDSTPMVITIDTTPPTAPIITGPANNSTLTTDKPTFTGTGEAGTIVEVLNEFGELVCTTTVLADGSWTCTPTNSQGEGTHEYTATLRDSAGNTSPNSTPPTKITLDITTDGATTLEENASPNNGDSNGDGIQDSRQQNVAAKPNPNLAGEYITLAVDPNSNCPDIRDYYFKSEPQLANQDGSFEYPLGLFGFKLKCKAPGDSANVTIYLDKVYNTSAWKYRKYNTVNGQYKDMSSATTYGTATIAGKTITTIKFVATDGNEFDEDGQANGEYVDPNGPAISTTNPISNPVAAVKNLLRTGGYNQSNYKIVFAVIILVITYTATKTIKRR
jgi:large repetitive protein